jgi:hypothetical protein
VKDFPSRDWLFYFLLFTFFPFEDDVFTGFDTFFPFMEDVFAAAFDFALAGFFLFHCAYRRRLSSHR